MARKAATFDDLADGAFIRQAFILGNAKRPEIAPLIDISPATFWRWIKNGKFPKPVKMGANSTFWRVGDVRAWMADHLAQSAAVGEVAA